MMLEPIQILCVSLCVHGFEPRVHNWVPNSRVRGWRAIILIGQRVKEWGRGLPACALASWKIAVGRHGTATAYG
jgi:hypothetical protein